MIIIRPINKQDLNTFIEFSFDTALGMRNLPRNREKLEEKIKKSEHSFAKHVHRPNQEEYLFVLEDLSTKRIGGMCGILANLDVHNTYYYKIETLHTHAKHPFAAKEMKVLSLSSAANKQASEVCSLYLQPTFRHSGQGRLLSLSRFLFIATHRERFEKKITAAMRGYIDQRQISPFWEAVGRHFCNLSFVELMAQLEKGNIDISEILPAYPLYIALLPNEAQEVIGKTHEMTKPALHMLLHEGFMLTNEVDALEAGPSLIANTSQIRTIKQSTLIQIETTSENVVAESECILANTQIDFRACYGTIEFVNKTVGRINTTVAEALNVKTGDHIRYVTFT